MGVLETIYWHLNRRSVFVGAVLLALMAHLGDIVTSMTCRYVPWCEEANTDLRDPQTHAFILVKGLEFKALFWFLWLVPLSFLVYRATKSRFLAALPFIIEAYLMWRIVVDNVMNLVP